MTTIEKPPVLVLALAVAAVGLCAAHFLRGDAPAPQDTAAKPKAAAVNDWSREEGQQRDAKLMEEFRDGRKPTLLDSKLEKQQKELTRNLRQYGLNPVEMQGGVMSGSAQGIKVLETEADVAELVKSGGYVAGMRVEDAEARK